MKLKINLLFGASVPRIKNNKKNLTIWVLDYIIYKFMEMVGLRKKGDAEIIGIWSQDRKEVWRIEDGKKFKKRIACIKNNLFKIAEGR